MQLGSTVVLETPQGEKTFEIVGPAESNPSRGRISHLSPLGEALIGQTIHATVTVRTEQGEFIYLLKTIL